VSAEVRSQLRGGRIRLPHRQGQDKHAMGRGKVALRASFQACPRVALTWCGCRRVPPRELLRAQKWVRSFVRYG